MKVLQKVKQLFYICGCVAIGMCIVISTLAKACWFAMVYGEFEWLNVEIVFFCFHDSSMFYIFLPFLTIFHLHFVTILKFEIHYRLTYLML